MDSMGVADGHKTKRVPVFLKICVSGGRFMRVYDAFSCTSVEFGYFGCPNIYHLIKY